MDYDVFISCKSEDYKDAHAIYNFLTENNYIVFLADAELRKRGNTEYGKIIDKALESAEHFILFASKEEYINSSYVEQEWRIFLEEKRSGRKKGNIISICKNLDLASLPIGIRHFQSFSYEDFNSVIDYLPKLDTGDNNSKQRKWSVGDYYHANGKEGVVFWVDTTGLHGKIVSMIENDCVWAIKAYYKTETHANNMRDGLKNLEVIQKTPDWKIKFPAFSFCQELGNEWYLPAIDELRLLLLEDKIRNVINATLEQEGARKLGDPTTIRWYWSSTEHGAHFAHFASMMFNEKMTESYCKNERYTIRPIARF